MRSVLDSYLDGQPAVQARCISALGSPDTDQDAVVQPNDLHSLRQQLQEVIRKHGSASDDCAFLPIQPDGASTCIIGGLLHAWAKAAADTGADVAACLAPARRHSEAGGCRNQRRLHGQRMSAGALQPRRLYAYVEGKPIWNEFACLVTDSGMTQPTASGIRRPLMSKRPRIRSVNQYSRVFKTLATTSCPSSTPPASPRWT